MQIATMLEFPGHSSFIFCHQTPVRALY